MHSILIILFFFAGSAAIFPSLAYGKLVNSTVVIDNVNLLNSTLPVTSYDMPVTSNIFFPLFFMILLVLCALCSFRINADYRSVFSLLCAFLCFFLVFFFLDTTTSYGLTSHETTIQSTFTYHAPMINDTQIIYVETVDNIVVIPDDVDLRTSVMWIFLILGFFFSFITLSQFSIFAGNRNRPN